MTIRWLAAAHSWCDTPSGCAPTAARQVLKNGVSVLSVAPGPIATAFASRAGMQMSMSQRPEVVARSALAALGRRRTERLCSLSKFLGWSLAMLPRRGRVQVTGLIKKGMVDADASSVQDHHVAQG